MRLTILLLVIGLSGYSHSQEVTFSTFQGNDPITKISVDIMANAYQRLGLTLKVLPQPGQRSLLTADSGLIDGELFRIKGMDEIYKNLIRVPIAIVEIDIVAFSRKENSIVITGWESLTPYKVGYNRGVKVIEENLLPPTRVEPSNTVENALKMLDAGRTDIAIDGLLNGLMIINDLGLDNIVSIEPPLEVIHGYHYLHKKNLHLLKPLTEVLREMEEAGVIRSYRDKILSEIRKKQ
ncbi:ABC transporter substrate-binding protein [Hahella sp. HN01]|uniref:substrate-binding periplasmic protein n=1 Tax=Hahella sp. HN01 TaxID=2847262 RepID=UPI001C1E9220|nr:transporter substrate-binding domain-containing protein [Hahella sp. HN01]MBU6952289.1 transporter substrate-binding domain-containing protein [Hahella sp. HN01]